MRMMPVRYLDPKPLQVKKQVAQIQHVSAPLKGLSQSSKLTTGDPLTAVILSNFVVDDDRISSRAGYLKMFTDTDAMPIEALIPFYGQPQRLLAATNHKLINAADGILVQAGFTSNDWHWTSYSNLAEADYTVMVNGADGVWSWDGNLVADPGVVGPTGVSISKANPAVATVPAGDIAKFRDGQVVTIAGAAGTGMVNANGRHLITSVGLPPGGANTFVLVGVDTSTASGPQTTGITIDPPGSVQKELITPAPGDTWINSDQFQIVLTHQGRLFFADSTNLAVYYLPVDQKSTVAADDLKVLPLNQIFRRGGYIRAMYTWTVDGGVSMNDQLVIFSSNGEAAIYSGIDPETDFQLTGIFRFDAPMSKHCCINYGGDLYVLISTGLVPMTTVIREETEQLGKSEKSVVSLFLEESISHRNDVGWSIMLNPSSGRLICNVPLGAPGRYRQLVRHMPRPVWSEWNDIPSRCWGWIDPYVYFGDDTGSIYRMHPQYLSDDGKEITVDVQMAWSQYKAPGIKHFKFILPYMITDGDPRPLVDVKVDYDYTAIANQPDITQALTGASWGEPTIGEVQWATDTEPGEYWATGDSIVIKLKQGVAAKGNVAAPRLTARLSDCRFAVSGFDVVYETGSVIG